MFNLFSGLIQLFFYLKIWVLYPTAGCLSNTRFFYKQRFFHLSLSVANVLHELSFRYCLGVA